MRSEPTMSCPGVGWEARDRGPMIGLWWGAPEEDFLDRGLAVVGLWWTPWGVEGATEEVSMVLHFFMWNFWFAAECDQLVLNMLIMVTIIVPKCVVCSGLSWAHLVYVFSCAKCSCPLTQSHHLGRDGDLSEWGQLLLCPLHVRLQFPFLVVCVQVTAALTATMASTTTALATACLMKEWEEREEEEVKSKTDLLCGMWTCWVNV